MVDTRTVFTISTYMKYATIPSTLILVLLAFLQRRNKPYKCGYHHPALIVPMRFLDGYRDRWAYALSFGAITGIIFSLFFQSVQGDATSNADTLFCPVDDSALAGACNQTWVKTLTLQGQSLVASLVCAPHFACITTAYKLIGALLGFAYSCFWIAFYVVGAINNEEDLGKTFGSLYLVRDIPVILCFLGLCIRSVWAIYRCYMTRSIRVKEFECIVETHQVNHVIALFQKPKEEPPPPEDLKGRLVAKFKPKIFPHFKLPTRIISIAFVQFLSVYYIGVTFSVVGVLLRDQMKFLLEMSTFLNTTVRTEPIINIFEGTFITAEIVGLASSVIYITLFVINYRYNMIKIYKGIKAEFLVGPQSTSQHMARSLRLPGYQIAYILWGFMVIFVAVFLFLLILCYGIYLLREFGMLESAFLSVLQTLSVPAMTIATFYMQVLLVRAFLLQPKLKEDDEHRPLNVNNRHLYEVISYILVFSNLLVGLASALFRTAKSFLLGVIFLGRLDRCLLMRGFEQMDPGYMAYVGTLLVDNAHNNPVMRTFCAVLVSLTCKNDRDRDGFGIKCLPQPAKLCSNSRAARRWHIAYTLIHNPDLLPRRKLALLLTRGLEDDDRDEKKGNVDGGKKPHLKSSLQVPEKKLNRLPVKRDNNVPPEVEEVVLQVEQDSDTTSHRSTSALVPESPTRFEIDHHYQPQTSNASRIAAPEPLPIINAKISVLSAREN